MAIGRYPALVTQDEGGAYIAEVIGFENAFSEGGSVNDALSNLEDALAGILEVMHENGEKLPEPVPIDIDAVRDKKYGDGIVSVVGVPLPGRAVKVSVTIDEGLLKRIDSIAGNYGRSEFLATAAREKLAAAKHK